MNRKKQSVSYRIIGWILPIIFLLFWEIFSRRGWINARFFPAPTLVLQTGYSMILSGELFRHLRISTYRALIGLAIGGGIGFTLGLVNGLFPLASNLFDTTLQMIRNIPHLALVPIVIIWFGIDETAKIFLVSLGVFFPIYVNTYHGIRTVDPGFIEMGRVYGLNSKELITNIILPGALPSIFVGLRYSLGIMWLTLIVAETIASDSGIGYMAMNAREFMRTDVIILSILIYALLGKLADFIVQIIESMTLKWHPSYVNKDEVN